MRKFGLWLATVFMLFSTTLAAAAEGTAYDYSFTAIDGAPMPLSDYKGKVLLVVNTASLCGLTPQYTGLQKLYSDYKDQGLVIIGVPSNDFGGQEPGSAAEVLKFTKDTYGVTFPLTQKAVVSGKDADPFYIWAGQQKAGGFFTAKPRWNFHKYLIDRNGVLQGSFASWSEPDNDELKAAIEKALKTQM